MSKYVTVSTTNTWDTKYVTVSNTWAIKDTVTSYFTKYTLCTALNSGERRFSKIVLRLLTCPLRGETNLSPTSFLAPIPLQLTTTLGLPWTIDNWHPRRCQWILTSYWFASSWRLSTLFLTIEPPAFKNLGLEWRQLVPPVHHPGKKAHRFCSEGDHLKTWLVSALIFLFSSRFSYLDQTSTSSLPYALSSSWDIVRRPKTTSFLQELRESGCTTTIRRRTARASLPGRRNWRVVQPGGGDQGQAWWNVWGEIKKGADTKFSAIWSLPKSLHPIVCDLSPSYLQERRQEGKQCVSSIESDYLCEDLRCTWSSVGVAPIR